MKEQRRVLCSSSSKKVLDPQEAFLVPRLSKKRIKLAIPILEELAPPRETDQASTPCEPPVEAGRVCG